MVLVNIAHLVALGGCPFNRNPVLDVDWIYVMAKRLHRNRPNQKNYGYDKKRKNMKELTPAEIAHIRSIKPTNMAFTGNLTVAIL